MNAYAVRFAFLAALAAVQVVAQTPGYGPSSGASRPDPHAPMDEPMGGRTAAGNPVPKRGVQDFPAESRDVFTPMDRRLGEGGQLVPLELNTDQIRGRNTWLLWCAGNETFWSWLQQYGYGFTDFLKVVDSAGREGRFDRTGLSNQPGMAPRKGRGPWGLRIDELVTPLPNTDGRDPAGNEYPVWKDPAGAELRSDGVNPAIYGYPSGVVGIRLFPNPDFTAEQAKRWDPDRYYNDPSYYLDPALVRPLRVGMSCGVCHVGPHPLVPAADPNHPAWENLSSNIGAQYLKTQEVFGNLLPRENVIHHYLRSQQPGTIDTSLTANDHINNANTMNAVWDIPARLARARGNPPERQSAANQLMPSIEDGAAAINPRHTPRVLVDGSDSIGAFGALARVYLNIGTFYEEWNRVQNPIIGIRAQRPFSIATCEANSVFWQVNEKYRAGYLAAFFTHPLSTAPMKLADVARHGAEPHRSAAQKALAGATPAEVAQGRAVFIQHCMVCHSSKQPEGFVRVFAAQVDQPWDHAPAQAGTLTLPGDYANWEAFKRSPGYSAYVAKARELAGPAPAAGAEDPFLKDNFLSVDLRIPVTLVGTNSARSVATNALEGHVWSDFSSDDYKRLPAVGKIRFRNPYKPPGADIDAFGNNDEYAPPGGGPGYYRPASLISLWATAPFLHNNALGKFTGKTDVASRLEMFDDAIRKLLWNKLRTASANGDTRIWPHTGDTSSEPWRRVDASGWIYRTNTLTALAFPAKFIRPLFNAVLGSVAVMAVGVGLFVLAAALILAAVFTGRVLPPHLPGVVALALGALAAWVFYGKGMAAFTVLPAWIVVAALFAAGAAALLWLRSTRIARLLYLTAAAGLLVAGILLQLLLAGRLANLSVGPIPAGVPISLLLNLNPDSDPAVRLDALTAVFKGTLAAKKHPDPAGALAAFESVAGAPLVRASKCPDYVLTRGHWFGETLNDADKEALIAFLRTL